MKERALGVVGGLLVLGGMFLPFISMLSSGLPVKDLDDAPIFYVLAGVGILSSLLKFSLGQFFGGIGTIITIFYEWKQVTMNGFLSQLIKRGTGYYLMFAGAIILIINSFLVLFEKNLKSES